MTRENKYRAWDSQQKVMLKYEVHGSSLYIKFNGDVVSIDREGDETVEKVELMQFTGLLDKNGKEIYENDILRFPDTVTTAPQEILRSQNGAHYRTRNAKGWFGDPKSWSDVEIIGNIYENPELL